MLIAKKQHILAVTRKRQRNCFAFTEVQPYSQFGCQYIHLVLVTLLDKNENMVNSMQLQAAYYLMFQSYSDLNVYRE